MSLAPTRARMRHGWLGSTVLGCALVLGGQNADAVHLPPSAQVLKRAKRLPSRLNTLNRGRASRWYAAIEAMLENAEVELDAANPTTSANATRIVTLRTLDGRRLRGVWKPVDGERATIEAYAADSPFAGTRPYPLKTLFLNEIRAARLANALGLQFLVGPTVERTIGGQRGSLQLLVEDARSAEEHPTGATLRREEAELLRVFDYLIGNADRIARNLLVRERGGQYLPVGIDHGLTFPVGTTLGLATRPFATEWIEGHVGPLLDSTREFIKSIPAETVAQVLMKTGADPRQAAHALRRLERLKRDPSFLEVKTPGAAGMKDMLARVRIAAEERNQGLESETLEELNKIIEAAGR